MVYHLVHRRVGEWLSGEGAREKLKNQDCGTGVLPAFGNGRKFNDGRSARARRKSAR